MRRSQDSLTPASVHTLFHKYLLQHLPLADFKDSVTALQLADLLTLMAATARTLFATVRERFPFSHETARKAVYACLPELDTLAVACTNLFHAIAGFSALERKRSWILALDTHNDPYYGSRKTKHILGGQRNRGTKYFHVYASAALLHKHRRYTIALLPITESLPVHAIVEKLLEQIRSRGLKIKGVVLDSGFDSADTILLLQNLGVSYTVPLRRKGSTSNRRNDLFAHPSGTLLDATWKSEKTRKEVTTRVLVWQRPGEATTEVKVFAFQGWGDARAVAEFRRARLARQRYRERFGIETSYRQKNQALAWTTSRDSTYRFLLEALGQALRQLWVRLTQTIAQVRGLKPTAWVGELTLVDLLQWLTERLFALHPRKHRIELAGKDLEPQPAC